MVNAPVPKAAAAGTERGVVGVPFPLLETPAMAGSAGAWSIRGSTNGRAVGSGDAEIGAAATPADATRINASTADVGRRIRANTPRTVGKNALAP
ncbi:unannotated protein [freshwater metagenome]|uniref:Unannotated protein n=1 Tax=freshwater metagenome TaxID=449393 RepID=A0A6J7RDU4_9ZZZZ